MLFPLLMFLRFKLGSLPEHGARDFLLALRKDYMWLLYSVYHKVASDAILYNDLVKL